MREQIGRLPTGADWIDRNFEALANEGLLKRQTAGAYSITETGAARAVTILDKSGCLNFHVFHTEKNFTVQHEILKRASEAWLARRGGQAGKQNHILIESFRKSL